MATPKLRFKEFNYEYNFQELQDFCTITSEKYNPINTKNLPCIELEHLATNNGGLLGYTNSNEQKSIFRMGVDFIFIYHVNTLSCRDIFFYKLCYG